MMIVERKTTLLLSMMVSVVTDLFKDGLHLLDRGKQSLANNFIFNINSFLSPCTNRSGQGTLV